jgi:hypothetical protein
MGSVIDSFHCYENSSLFQADLIRMWKSQNMLENFYQQKYLGHVTIQISPKSEWHINYCHHSEVQYNRRKTSISIQKFSELKWMCSPYLQVCTVALKELRWGDTLLHDVNTEFQEIRFISGCNTDICSLITGQSDTRISFHSAPIHFVEKHMQLFLHEKFPNLPSPTMCRCLCS